MNHPAVLPEVREAGFPIRPALYLAPMEGVTDPSFRGLVLDSCPGAVGAACTEFLRVTQTPLPNWKLAAELGRLRSDASIGIQLMGNVPEAVAETSIGAAEVGAAFVDLNFGCPAPRVFQHCAGSALLNDPPLLERMVRTVVDACPLPVSAKIRAGVENDHGLLDVCKRIEQAGAQLLTVHGRLRVTSYREPARWDWIRDAKQAVSIPVIGNGSAESAESIDAMFEQTGCDGVMIGRGVIRDPWLPARWLARRTGSAEPQPNRAQVLAWMRDYSGRMRSGGATERNALGRLKQSAKAMRDSYLQEAEVAVALRSQSEEDFFALLTGQPD